MSQAICLCNHEKLDHRRPLRGSSDTGECRICLCPTFRKRMPPQVMRTEIAEYTSLPAGAPMIDWVLERLERKRSPQGLNVIAEELQWMGHEDITHDKLLHAVRLELRKPRPRILAVAEEVYWFADKQTPAGWSLYSDKRMLPCFYRIYPPEISLDELDKPENILPPPQR